MPSVAFIRQFVKLLRSWQMVRTSGTETVAAMDKVTKPQKGER